MQLKDPRSLIIHHKWNNFQVLITQIPEFRRTKNSVPTFLEYQQAKCLRKVLLVTGREPTSLETKEKAGTVFASSWAPPAKTY